MGQLSSTNHSSPSSLHASSQNTMNPEEVPIQLSASTLLLSGFQSVQRSNMMMMMKKKSFCVLICSLAALLTAEAGSLRDRGRDRLSVFSSSFPSSSSSSSSSYSFSSSFESSGGVCLNGGTSVPALISGEHMFCMCPDGYTGEKCETANSGDCYEGLGLYYKGTVSKSASGRTCEEWDSDSRQLYLSADVNSGRHNYCRNLFYRRRPWCYVRRNLRLVWEYCGIPRCTFESIPAQPSPAPAPADPEPAADTCGRRNRRKLLKIVGGTVATVESHPWVAAIFWRSATKEKVFRCGGSLISSCWVLTAAHCFPDGSHTKNRRFSVILGKNALNESDPTMEQAFRVEEIILHEGFDNSEGNFNNDIALLKLRAKQGKCAEVSNSVKTVCLPPPQQSLHSGMTCEIAGYGKEKFGLWYKSQYLREAQVNLLTDNMCRREDYYGNKITENMFCAGRPDWSQDACEGDSGGPLACEVGDRLFLFGVISWGDGCSKAFRPGVYTKVTNYNRWIEEKTGLSSITAGSMFPQK